VLIDHQKGGYAMPLDVSEAMGYLGMGENPPEDQRVQVSAVARRLEGAIQPRYTYKSFALERRDGALCIPELSLDLPWNSTRTMLAQCSGVVVLVCTLGVRFDAMLRGEQARDMAQAVILDACGSAWVEHGCDQAEQEIRARFPGRYLTDRFSPGYGDLPLSLQPALCAALDAGRRLGVTVGERFLMNPCKTVTAFIGLSDRPQRARIRGCDYCAMRETCQLRKGGKRCGT
jgi:hypothetical protein